MSHATPPEGFYKRLVNGTCVGLGFYCPLCKVNYRQVGPRAVVKHCRREDSPPKITAFLPEHKLLVQGAVDRNAPLFAEV
jgi:hypothetical protein